MPTIDYISRDERPPESQIVLDQIKKQEGYISKVYKLLARDPRLLKAFWEFRQAVMGKGLLDRRTKEMIAYAVAVAKECEYCIWAHAEELKKLDVSQDELLEITGIVSLLSSFNAVFSGTQLKYVK